GNAAELIIALVALSRGPHMHALVKASITGSIIGNVLLVLGLAALVGGLRRPRLKFDRTAAGGGATPLALASVGLIVPSVYNHIFRLRGGPNPADARIVANLSEEIAAVLAGIYLLSLVFTLRRGTAAVAETPGPPTVTGEPKRKTWGVWASVAV